jgi:hypothetical protein
MHKVRQTPDILGTHSLAGFECSELLQVEGICTLGFQISVEKRCMTDFVESLAGYILWSITIEVRQGYLIVVQRLVRVYFDGWFIADTAQFRVLGPKVRFDQLRCGEKTQNRDVALGRPVVAVLAKCASPSLWQLHLPPTPIFQERPAIDRTTHQLFFELSMFIPFCEIEIRRPSRYGKHICREGCHR